MTAMTNAQKLHQAINTVFYAFHYLRGRMRGGQRFAPPQPMNVAALAPTRSIGAVVTLLIVCLNTVLAQSPPPVSFLAASAYGAGSFPQSVAVGDFNGDGKLDLALADQSSGTVSVLLGNGDGTFQAAVSYSAGPQLYSVTVGDFNGDGKLDLVATSYSSNSVSVLLGKGDGT